MKMVISKSYFTRTRRLSEEKKKNIKDTNIDIMKEGPERLKNILCLFFSETVSFSFLPAGKL